MTNFLKLIALSLVAVFAIAACKPAESTASAPAAADGKAAATDSAAVPAVPAEGASKAAQ